MVYQIQVDVDGQVVGMEVLVCWYDKELGYVLLNEFVLVVEVLGLMVQLGDYVLDYSLVDFSWLL